MNGILTLAVCRTGLRVGQLRLFGPFCRPFLVPWAKIAVTRRAVPFRPLAELQFGEPIVGTLVPAAHAADRLAGLADGQWPEPGPVPAQDRGAFVRRLLVSWAVTTAAAALFFTVVMLTVVPRDAFPQVLAVIPCVAVMIGGVTYVRYLRERG